MTDIAEHADEAAWRKDAQSSLQRGHRGVWLRDHAALPAWQEPQVEADELRRLHMLLRARSNICLMACPCASSGRCVTVHAAKAHKGFATIPA
jgi:hypothetical protein